MLKRLYKNKLLLVTIVLYALTLLFSKEITTIALKNTLHYLREMLFVMPVIFMLTVFIDVWVSKGTIIKHMGENSGVKGVAFSVLLGSLSAGPIYAAFPICKMLLAKGASITNLVVILSAWAVIKVPMLANEARFLGPKFMTIRWILTVIVIYLMGYIISLLVKKESIIQVVEPVSSGINISQTACVGCGVCAKKYPSSFMMKDKKAYATACKENWDQVTVEAVTRICPVSAITYGGTE